MNPNELTVAEGISFVREGRLSVTEWCKACIDQVERVDPYVHAWVHFDPEVALRQAAVIEKRISDSGFEGHLWGAPFAVKDVFNTADLPTWMGSPIWEGFTPGNDARVVAHLKWEGGLMFGKSVTAEFAVHHPGPTVNPHNPHYSPGTSSSGSAAAVATFMVPLALGTQTAGSTIRPASYCGIYGMKPSFGVVPRTGILKTLDTLDHVSFFARSPEDLELVFESARVRGKNHPFVHEHLDNWTPEKLRKPFRVAFVRGPAWAQAEPYAQEQILSLMKQWEDEPDIQLSEIELPEVFLEAHSVHELVYTKALSYYFRDEYENHRNKLSDVFRSMLEEGGRITSDAYWKGLERQKELGRELDRFFDEYDFILNLSTSGEAPKGLHGRDKKDCCLIWTLCHVPAVNLPAFESPNGLPFGAQLIARRYNDLPLLWFARWLRERGLFQEKCSWTPEKVVSG